VGEWLLRELRFKSRFSMEVSVNVRLDKCCLALVVVGAGTVLAAQNMWAQAFTIEQALSAPYCSELKASRRGRAWHGWRTWADGAMCG